MDTRLLLPKNFSKRDQVDYLTVEYFESSWNLENLELEFGPAQPDLFSVNIASITNFSKQGDLKELQIYFGGVGFGLTLIIRLISVLNWTGQLEPWQN